MTFIDQAFSVFLLTLLGLMVPALAGIVINEWIDLIKRLRLKGERREK